MLFPIDCQDTEAKVSEARTRVTRRRVQRIITADEILDAAAGVVDAEGLAALSMRRIADATGVAPMTIYGFFDGKDELVARLRVHVLRELPPPLDPDRPWKDRIVHELSSLHGALQRHHGLLELLSDRTDALPMLDELRERLVAILRTAGIDDQTIIQGLGSLVALTLGFAVGERARQSAPGANAYERLRNLPREGFPNLSTLAVEYPMHWSDQAYDYGVAAVLAAMAGGVGHDQAR
jgi:AcrR family transcriptional regulator